MGTSFPYPAYVALRDHGKGFSDVFAFFSLKSVTAVARGEASTTPAMLVSGNYFSGYGVTPSIGRTILPEDDRVGAPPVAVITYRWWEQHFGLDPNVLGQSITLNKVSYTIIGVLPRDYAGPVAGDPGNIYFPMAAQPHLAPSRPLDSTNQWWVQIMGRLAPGANEAQAQASAAVVFRQALEQSGASIEKPGIALQDGSRGQLTLRRKIAKPIIALTFVGGLVLLAACANLAGLLLARATTRQHEMSVRTAMGASRWQLVRQLLLESLMLSFAGAALGLAVAVGINRSLMGLFASLPDGFHFDLRIDANVLLFTLGVSVLAAMLFGLLPGLRISHVELSTGLKAHAPTTAPRLRMGRALVVAQIGLSVMFVFGAALMTRSFWNLRSLDPGFNSENLLLFRLDPGQVGYSGQKLSRFYDQARSVLGAIPGVRAVSYSSFALASNSYSSESIEFPGRDKQPGQNLETAVLSVSADFFRTMSIPIVTGREFASLDSESAPPVGIVNQAFVRRFLPGESALGCTVIAQDGTGRALQIVGVSRDAVYDEPRAEVPPVLYLSQQQRPDNRVFFELRTALPALSLLPAARKAIAAIDPDVPLSQIRTQQEQLERSMSTDRLFASLGSALAGVAVLLSCIGLNGLIAYQVARRTREIGIRIALGASPRAVARMIFREALLLAVTGLAIGLPSAFAIFRLVRSQLYGVVPGDSASLLATGALLLTVATLAVWMPVRRAMRVDPMLALRCE
jgi:predicted permease